MNGILHPKTWLAFLVAVSLYGQQAPLAPETKAAYQLATDARLSAFLKARKQDLRSGTTEPYHAFLEDVIQKGALPERMWALTRETEAGDYTRFSELVEHMISHVQGVSKSRSGHKEDVLPERLPRVGEVFRIHQGSPWWASLEKSIRESPDREVSAALYALWCYNTRPSQRELVFEIASHIRPKALGRFGGDPWSDPRFWIVMDWVIAWGEPEDFDRMEHVIPEGVARNAFLRHTRELIKLPGFFACTLPTPDLDGVIASPLDLQPARSTPGKTAIPGLLEISNLKVEHQPATPRYPLEARTRGLMARLKVRAIVGVDGAPCGYRPIPGPWLAFFAPCGVGFLKDWRFVPATLSGIAHPSVFHLVMPFNLAP